MNTNRDAYREIVAARLAAGWSHENAAAQGDALLTLMEQREREGRFGAEEVPPPAGYSLKGWANPNAVKRYEETIKRAEAEVERLKLKLTEEASAWRDERKRADDAEKEKIGLIKARHEDAAHLSEVCAAKDKAESFLKEALGSLREWAFAVKGGSGMTERRDAILDRARQEGFEP